MASNILDSQDLFLEKNHTTSMKVHKVELLTHITIENYNLFYYIKMYNLEPAGNRITF